ncbi:MAG TPA: VCBS repeat-containing protein, partial [Vicinamibacterales bacterium]
MAHSTAGLPFHQPTGLHVTLADFDNDNRLDLAVTEFGSGVFVDTGHGDGAFSNPVHVLPYSTSQSASAADMNEDGRL